MRITQNKVLDNMLAELNKNRSKYATLTKQLATQKRVNLPSDDSLAYSSSQEKESLLKRNEQYQSNLASGLEQARVVDETIVTMIDQLFELKSIATRGANGSANSDGDNEILADNVAAIRDNLVSFTNTSVNGRYIFSGTRTDTASLSVSGSTVTYQGNTQDLVIKANENTDVAYSINANDLFEYNGSDSVFDLLTTIETALRNNDTTAVNAELGNIDLSVEHLARQASQIGNSINKMEFAYQSFETTNINLQEQISRLVDTDFADAATQLQQLDIAYNAALNLTSRSAQLSLLNYL